MHVHQSVEKIQLYSILVYSVFGARVLWGRNPWTLSVWQNTTCQSFVYTVVPLNSRLIGSSRELGNSGIRRIKIYFLQIISHSLIAWANKIILKDDSFAIAVCIFRDQQNGRSLCAWLRTSHHQVRSYCKEGISYTSLIIRAGVQLSRNKLKSHSSALLFSRYIGRCCFCVYDRYLKWTSGPW